MSPAPATCRGTDSSAYHPPRMRSPTCDTECARTTLPQDVLNGDYCTEMFRQQRGGGTHRLYHPNTERSVSRERMRHRSPPSMNSVTSIVAPSDTHAPCEFATKHRQQSLPLMVSREGLQQVGPVCGIHRNRMNEGFVRPKTSMAADARLDQHLVHRHKVGGAPAEANVANMRRCRSRNDRGTPGTARCWSCGRSAGWRPRGRTWSAPQGLAAPPAFSPPRSARRPAPPCTPVWSREAGCRDSIRGAAEKQALAVGPGADTAWR